MDSEGAVRPTEQEAADVIVSINGIFADATAHPLALNAAANADALERYLMTTVRERYGDRYDFTSNSYFYNGELRIVVEMFLTDYRIPVIRDIQFRLYGHICCGEHICGVNTYMQIFEHVLSHRHTRFNRWNDEMLNYGFNFVLSNLYRMLLAMNRHRRLLGMSVMF